MFTGEDALVPLAMVPEGCEIEGLERYLPSPTRIRQYVTVATVDSFIGYLDKFAHPTGAIFANEPKSQIVAVLDYHGMAGEAHASWCTHRLTLDLKKSREWHVWRGKHGLSLTQAQFADFLEDNNADIVHPEAASVLEAAMHLEATKTVKFRSALNLDNGATQFTYDEAVEGKGKGTIKVPSRFTIRIPIMAGQHPTDIEARLRYRISDEGGLTFTYKLANPDKLLEDQFEAICVNIAEETGIVPFMGTLD